MIVDVEIGDDEILTLEVNKNSTVQDLRQQISSEKSVSTDDIELIHNNTKIEDHQQLRDLDYDDKLQILCIISSENHHIDNSVIYENNFPDYKPKYQTEYYNNDGELISNVKRKYKYDPENFESNVIYIQNMGFPHKFAKNALRYTKYDVKAAIALLCGVTLEELDGRLKPDEEEQEEEENSNEKSNKENTDKSSESSESNSEQSDNDSYQHHRRGRGKKAKSEQETTPTYAMHWTPDQDELLYEKWMKYGSDWGRILKYFPGRTKAAVSLHWNASLRQKMIASGRITIQDLRRKNIRAPIAIDLATSAADAPDIPRRKSSRSRKSRRKVLNDSTSSSSNEEEEAEESKQNSDNEDKNENEKTESEPPKQEETEKPKTRGRRGRKAKNAEIKVWTPEDDELLFNSWMNHGNDWSQIAESFNGRDTTELSIRWNTIVRPKMIEEGRLTEDMLRSKNSRAYSHMRTRDNQYSSDEDEKSGDEDESSSNSENDDSESDESGNDNFEDENQVERHTVKRRGRPIRSWTSEMDNLLFEKWKIYGNDWARYSKIFPDRSAVAVKLHWCTKLQKHLIAKGLLDPTFKPPKAPPSDEEDSDKK